MRHLSPAKLAYQSKNLQDWCDYHGIKGFRFPSNFPLRTVLPMRVLLANDKGDHKLEAILCKLISSIIQCLLFLMKFYVREKHVATHRYWLSNAIFNEEKCCIFPYIEILFGITVCYTWSATHSIVLHANVRHAFKKKDFRFWSFCHRV